MSSSDRFANLFPVTSLVWLWRFVSTLLSCFFEILNIIGWICTSLYFLIYLRLECWSALYFGSLVCLWAHIFFHGLFWNVFCISFLCYRLYSFRWSSLCFFEIPFCNMDWFSYIIFLVLFFSADDFIWSGVPWSCSHASSYLRRHLVLLLGWVVLCDLEFVFLDDSNCNSLL